MHARRARSSSGAVQSVHRLLAWWPRGWRSGTGPFSATETDAERHMVSACYIRHQGVVEWSYHIYGLSWYHQRAWAQQGRTSMTRPPVRSRLMQMEVGSLRSTSY